MRIARELWREYDPVIGDREKLGMAENSKERNASRLGEKMNNVEVALRGLEHMGDLMTFDQQLPLNISEF
jgi:hypothetical protein